MTANYNIEYIFGHLVVTPTTSPLVVKSNDCEWMYDGTYRTCEDYTVTYGGDTIPECAACTPPPGAHQYVLPTGDTVTVSDPVSVRDVTDTVNGFEVVIQNPEHYSGIDTVYGNVKVNPIPLVITTDSNGKEYDGTPLTDHGWLDTPPAGLAPGDTVVFVDIYGTITEPGDSLNRAYPTAVVVNQTTGEDVTANYNIEYIFGHLVVTPCVSSLSIICPPDVRDTLAFGDCVMNIYPAKIGTPTINAPTDWPFTVSNDIPVDNLYSEGETIITWTLTDDRCGNTYTCQQKVIVVFPQCPDAIDCEGNVYHGVRIGCDCWTQTNLLSNCYGDPNECAESGECEDPIPCVYEYESQSFPNVEENVDIYGRLYCAEAALKDSVINEHGHIRGICPEGWYLPTPEKYEELYLHGGGTNILNANGLRSPLYWIDGGGDDATGFRALPAGFYNGAAQRYERMLLDTYFWATEVVEGEVRSTSYKISYDCSEIQRTEIHSGYGISVRCVKEKDQ